MKVEKAKLIIKARSKEMAEISAINSFGHIPVQQAIPISDVIKILDQLDQPKPVLKKEHAEWLEELKNEFPDNLPNQLYHITRQGWGYGLVFESNTGQKIKISNLDNGKLKKDLVDALIHGYTVQKEKLYRVKLNDHLYFKEFIDSMFPVFVIDDMPGALDEAFIGKKELALKHAREFGGRLEEVEEVTE